MKPISNHAFSNVILNYAEALWDTTSPKGLTQPATVITILNIGFFTDPQRHNLDDYENYIDQMVLRMYECTTEVKQLKDYLKFKINQLNESGKAIWWKIGDRYEIEETGESGKCYYSSFESFMANVDFSLVVKVVRKCWDRACVSENPFPADEAVRDYAKAYVGTNDLIE